MSQTRSESGGGQKRDDLTPLYHEILGQMSVLFRNAQLYGAANKVFDDPISRVRSAVASILKHEPQIDIERARSQFYVNKERIRTELRLLRTFSFVGVELMKRGMGGIQFTEVPSRQALAAVCTVFSRHTSLSEEGVDLFNRELIKLGGHGVAFLDLIDEEDQQFQPGDRRERAIQTYQEALDFIRECVTTVNSPADMSVRQAKRVVHKLVDLSASDGEGFSMLGLGAIKGHDDYTFNHMVNVCVIAIAFGRKLGFQRNDLAQLGLSALYHDMGKVHIPLEVLNKPGSLNEEEWATMGNHTVFAARTLFPLVASDPLMVQQILTALQHHKQYDGQGYPKLRFLKQQDLFTRVTSIVDRFDAMTTKRIYGRQFLPDEAISTLHESRGVRYDPALVKAFINCMGVFPVGSTVMLRSSEIAVVTQANTDLDHISQPMVKVVTDPGRQLLPQAFSADLSHPDQHERQIVRCVDAETFAINSAHYAI